SDNPLVALDLSGNPLLRELHVKDSPLGTLDLSANEALETLWLGGIFEVFEDEHGQPFVVLTEDALNSLTLGNKPELSDLDLSFTRLGSVNLAGLPKLVRFIANNAGLTALEVGANLLLQELVLAGNGLTEIDVTE